MACTWHTPMYNQTSVSHTRTLRFLCFLPLFAVTLARYSYFWRSTCNTSRRTCNTSQTKPQDFTQDPPPSAAVLKAACATSAENRSRPLCCKFTRLYCKVLCCAFACMYPLFFCASVCTHMFIAILLPLHIVLTHAIRPPICTCHYPHNLSSSYAAPVTPHHLSSLSPCWLSYTTLCTPRHCCNVCKTSPMTNPPPHQRFNTVR